MIEILIFLIHKIFDIFLYISKLSFIGMVAGKWTKSSPGPRLYPPTLWYNVVEIQNLLHIKTI